MIIKKFWFIPVIIVLIIGIWAFKKPSESRQTVGIQNLSPAIVTQTENKPKLAESINPIEKKLHQEATLVGRPDTAPDDTEERLQEWAHTLSAKELEQLEQAALNIKKPQDDRFLAVMLMAWSKKAEALEHLKDIALAEIDPFLSPNRMGDFERILRMQAIDGMIDLPAHDEHIEKTLQAVVARAGDSSIADRANRALWALRGDAPIPQEQDKKALEELLKKPKGN